MSATVSLQGEWKGETAGGCLNHCTWRNCPQFFLILLQQPSKQAKFSITLEQSPGTKRCDYGIGFYMTSSDQGYRRLTMEPEEVLAKTGFQQVKTVTLEVKLERNPHPYIIIPCTFGPREEANFVLTVKLVDDSPQGQTPKGAAALSPRKKMPILYATVANKFFLSPSPSISWNQSVITGDWSKARNTAGGCMNNNSWRNNTQYVLQTTSGARIYIFLKFDEKRAPESLFAIGFYVFEVDNTSKIIDEVKAREMMVSKSSFTKDFEVNKSFKVNKESYIILPSSLDPGNEGHFQLIAFSDKKVRLTSIGEKKAVKLTGEWKGDLTGGCLINNQWRNNNYYSLFCTSTSKTPKNITIVLVQSPNFKIKTQEDLQQLEYIGLYVFSSEGNMRPLIITNDTVIAKSKFTNSKDILVNLDIIPGVHYSILPCTYFPSIEKQFELEVFYDEAPGTSIQVKKIDPDTDWKLLTFEGEWMGRTAGGSHGFGGFEKNPYFVFATHKQAIVNIFLLQDSLQSILPAGFYLYKGNEKPSSTLQPYVRSNFMRSDEVYSQNVELSPGVYSIVPCTFEPNMEGTFTLNLYSTSPLATVRSQEVNLMERIQEPTKKLSMIMKDPTAIADALANIEEQKRKGSMTLTKAASVHPSSSSVSQSSSFPGVSALSTDKSRRDKEKDKERDKERDKRDKEKDKDKDKDREKKDKDREREKEKERERDKKTAHRSNSSNVTTSNVVHASHTHSASISISHTSAPTPALASSASSGIPSSSSTKNREVERKRSGERKERKDEDKKDEKKDERKEKDKDKDKDKEKDKDKKDEEQVMKKDQSVVFRKKPDARELHHKEMKSLRDTFLKEPPSAAASLKPPTAPPSPAPASPAVQRNNAAPILNEKMSDPRTMVLKEILATESRFVESLSLIVDNYLEPLKSKIPQLLSNDDFEVIFCNVADIRDSNQRLLAQLTARLKDIDENTKVGEIFLKSADDMICYSDYVNNYNNALTILSECRTRAEFAAFIDGIPAVNGLQFIDYLIMPVQRIPRYVLLLAELVKQTSSPEHPDYIDLKQALQRFKALAFQINEKKKEAENQFRLMKIIEKTAGDIEIVKPGRKFIREGVLSLIQGKNREKESSHRLFLFNDMLLLTKVVKKTSIFGSDDNATDDNLKFVNRVMLSESPFKFRDVDDQVFEVEIEGKPYLYEASSKHEKELWLIDFNTVKHDISKFSTVLS